MPGPQHHPPRAPLLYLLAGMVGGIALADRFSGPPGLLLPVAAAGAAFLPWLAARRGAEPLWTVAFIGVATLAFWSYGEMRLPAPPPHAHLERPPREANLDLRVRRVLYRNEAFAESSVLAEVRRAPRFSRLQAGDPIFARVARTAPDQPRIRRGHRIRCTGVLHPIPEQPPEAEGGDGFLDYLKRTGVHHRLERAHIDAVLKPPPPFLRFCNRANERFQEILRLGAPPDTGLENVYLAMLLGRKVELSPDQRERYRLSGTMHFFAISGLHIGVIATVIAQFLRIIRIPRTLSPLIGLPLLFLYVEITGGTPSATRAFLMAAFFWAAIAFRRQRTPLAALAGSAVFVLAIQPDQLHRLGFQLSYAVVLSILLFGLPLYEFLKDRLTPYRYRPTADLLMAHRAARQGTDTVCLLFAISLSAWLASAPLCAALFGYISPGAIFLNMLLVNLAAVTIVTGVVALATGLLFAPAAAFLNHAAWLTLAVMDGLVERASGIPGYLTHSEGFPIPLGYGTLAAYFAVVGWLAVRPVPPDGRLLWLPPALVGILLYAGV